MKPEYRPLVFVLTMLVGAPILYTLGNSLAGRPAAVLLPSLAAVAAWIYANGGGGPTTPPDAEQSRDS
ncbi:MAG: hypothetical protein ACQGVC_01880 [Myxococcota bacterium]